MFLVIEEQDFTLSRLNPPLYLFISKAHGLRAHDISLTSPILVTLLKQKKEKNTQQLLSVRSKKGWRRKERKTIVTNLNAIGKLFALHANAKRNFFVF